jgi:hypothetical protein
MKLYDLFGQPTKDAKSAWFIMRAPMSTLVMFLNLRSEAEARILRELQTKTFVDLHNYPSQGVHWVATGDGEIVETACPVRANSFCVGAQS